MKSPIHLVCSAVAALALLTGCMPYSTGATEVGVRTVKWSPFGNKGVEDKVYAPGSTYFFVPFITDWHTFDTRLQNLEMTAVTGRGDRVGRDDLLFKTIDGNDISLDVVMSYRIDPLKAPTILQVVGASAPIRQFGFCIHEPTLFAVAVDAVVPQDKEGPPPEVTVIPDLFPVAIQPEEGLLDRVLWIGTVAVCFSA